MNIFRVVVFFLFIFSLESFKFRGGVPQSRVSFKTESVNIKIDTVTDIGPNADEATLRNILNVAETAARKGEHHI